MLFRRAPLPVAAVAAAAILAGCTSSGTVVAPRTDVAVPEPPLISPPPPGAPADAPMFSVDSGQAEVELAPYTYCWTGPASGMCADGFPLPKQVVIAAGEELTVAFVTSEGELTAFAGLPDKEQEALPVSVGEDGWTVDLTPLPEGDQVVSLTWNGQQGDAHAVLTVRR